MQHFTLLVLHRVRGARSWFEIRNHRLPFRVVAATESHPRRATMPIILWLLGVPLSLIIILALLGVF
jgi:hypothetical protein